jgi:hypothetical protein
LPARDHRILSEIEFELTAADTRLDHGLVQARLLALQIDPCLE